MEFANPFLVAAIAIFLDLIVFKKSEREDACFFEYPFSAAALLGDMAYTGGVNT